MKSLMDGKRILWLFPKWVDSSQRIWKEAEIRLSVPESYSKFKLIYFNNI